MQQANATSEYNEAIQLDPARSSSMQRDAARLRCGRHPCTLLPKLNAQSVEAQGLRATWQTTHTIRTSWPQVAEASGRYALHMSDSSVVRVFLLINRCDLSETPRKPVPHTCVCVCASAHGMRACGGAEYERVRACALACHHHLWNTKNATQAHTRPQHARAEPGFRI